ncbi:MMPL family transporter [Nocardioides sp. HDW12B]|uniref:MMPL family transporter n=1 Tax=Nocardioides sp. HDW12B TaxID=2714939 RepID=UPI0014093196|nr:MMPL family transporter [Nocardioides sp. HDW12B]QIK67277.1 MMPL family transporter [Nocardioides sp. HDW12B]
MTSLTQTLSRHPRRSLAGLLLFVVLAGFFGGSVAGALDDDGGFLPADAESAAAVEAISAATGEAPSPGVVLLVGEEDGPAATPAQVESATERLGAVDGISSVVSAANAPPGARSGLVSEDGTRSLVLGTLAAGADDGEVADAVVEAYADDPDVTVGGWTVGGTQLGETVESDLARAETFAFPLLIVLSLIFFGGRAALMPLVVGITTVLGTFLALQGINQVYGLSIFALNLVIGLGLGLAIDYTLFLLTRYREEVARRGAGPDAIAVTMRTAGRSVVFSAATVAVAMITLTVFPLGFLKSMGIAGAVVAVVAALAALLVSPMVFGLWGAKLMRRSRGTGTDGQGRWYRLSHAVMRRPGAVAATTMLVMLGLALPALSAVWTPVDESVVPPEASARAVSDAVEAEFPDSGTSPMTVAIETDGTGAGSAGLTSYAEQVASLPGVATVAEPVRLGPDLWQLDVAVTGEPDDAQAQDLVTEVRALDAPFETQVAGPAADFVDQQQAIADALPLAAGLLVGLTMIVLWLLTGSVVLPIKAVIMNALTVGASLGALVFVYQGGRFTDVLGYTPNGGIEPTDFLVATALVFALSTDYGVFLLGRIKELRDAGEGERESVSIGLQRTGAVVTAAAILLAVAIGAFATSSISFIQQIGIATAFGVLVDAFVVRSLLVPALMGLLGKYNWWAPMPLRRLHDRIGFREESAPPAERELVPTP